MEKDCSFIGTIIKTLKVIIKARTGAKINILILIEKGNSDSFENNFTASLKGCITPIMLTLLGPFRS